MLSNRSSLFLGRAGQESDIGATVLFLAGLGGAFYNHQILFPDGGEVSGMTEN